MLTSYEYRNLFNSLYTSFQNSVNAEELDNIISTISTNKNNLKLAIDNIHSTIRENNDYNTILNQTNQRLLQKLNTLENYDLAAYGELKDKNVLYKKLLVQNIILIIIILFSCIGYIGGKKFFNSKIKKL